MTKLFETVRQLVETSPSRRSAAPIHIKFSDLLPDLGHARIYTDSDRALSAITPSAGGLTVGEDVRAVADALRPHSAVLTAGAVVLQVAANQTLPTITTGCTASWLSETGEISESNVVFGRLSLAPKRCACLLRVSNELLRTAPAIAEASLRRDLLGAIASAIDLAALSGIGGSEPTGLFFAADVPEITFGGAPTLAKVCELEQTLADNNGEPPTGPILISTPATRSKWRQTESLAGSGIPLWTTANTANGIPAVATLNAIGNRAVLGNWPDLLVAFFGDGVQALADPFSRKKSHETEILATVFADVGALRPKSFCRSSDSGAQ